MVSDDKTRLRREASLDLYSLGHDLRHHKVRRISSKIQSQSRQIDPDREWLEQVC